MHINTSKQIKHMCKSLQEMIRELKETEQGEQQVQQLKVEYVEDRTQWLKQLVASSTQLVVKKFYRQWKL